MKKNMEKFGYYCYNLTDSKNKYIFINKNTFNEDYDYCK